MPQPHSTGPINTLSLTAAALDIVYGDMGTSPLYALKEVFGSANHPVPITPGNVLGILSLVFWALLIVITGKYVSFVSSVHYYRRSCVRY